MASGYSLHIGVNKVSPIHYAGWEGQLNACEYDSQDMKSLATNAGYQTQILNTQDATRTNVVAAIKMIAKKTKLGDIFFLSYSGHGGQVTDSNDDEVDGKDETWCLFDGQLLDDELYRLYTSFPTGARIIVLSDSCHSGTVLRSMSTTQAIEAASAVSSSKRMSALKFRYRFMPRAHSRDTYQLNQEFYDGLQKKTKIPRMKAAVQLISGCQDNQYSLDGDYNGLFTGKLLQTWGNASFDGDYRSLHRTVAFQMPPTQSPNHCCLGPGSDNFASEYPFHI